MRVGYRFGWHGTTRASDSSLLRETATTALEIEWIEMIIQISIAGISIQQSAETVQNKDMGGTFDRSFLVMNSISYRIASRLKIYRGNAHLYAFDEDCNGRLSTQWRVTVTIFFLLVK